jgi:hypothetical protein
MINYRYEQVEYEAMETFIENRRKVYKIKQAGLGVGQTWQIEVRTIATNNKDVENN